ncbi:hypothetical protein CHARACLAT_031360 [Characodon lateralis]|uniref:Uncharacterized protein n=1 Tax=Characodon lateralis TaxID=208331 RepID=A0ABU7DVQ2_9TELE|nr:hypothetical protein [Characodon lateralis]
MSSPLSICPLPHQLTKIQASGAILKKIIIEKNPAQQYNTHGLEYSFASSALKKHIVLIVCIVADIKSQSVVLQQALALETTYNRNTITKLDIIQFPINDEPFLHKTKV